MQSNLSFSDFLASPPGRYVLRWEQEHLDRAVADIFGYHAVQLGLPEIDTLAENRMPLRLCVSDRLADERTLQADGSGQPSGRGVAAGASATRRSSLRFHTGPITRMPRTRLIAVSRYTLPKTGHQRSPAFSMKDQRASQRSLPAQGA